MSKSFAAEVNIPGLTEDCTAVYRLFLATMRGSSDLIYCITTIPEYFTQGG